MIQTLRKFMGGARPSKFGGASLETFSGEAQLKKSPYKNQVNLPYRPAIQCQHPLSRLCRPWWTCHGGWSIEHKCYVTNKLWLNFLDSPSASLKQTDKKQQIDNNKQANLQQTTHKKKTIRQIKNKVISNNKQTNSKQTSYKQTTNKQSNNKKETKKQ